jgi:hypothetical protein
MNNQVMRCKLQLHEVTTTRYAGQDPAKHRMAKVRFGAVWEGNAEKQAASENAIFGEMTPQAEFVATIQNGAVVDALVPGKKYYVTFTEAPD